LTPKSGRRAEEGGPNVENDDLMQECRERGMLQPVCTRLRNIYLSAMCMEQSGR
jgi:hypothetical protein